MAYEARGQYDVAVVGGGPAGSVAAMRIARLGWKTVLVEGDADQPRYGETLAPESNPLLRQLGLWEALQRSHPVESPGIVSYWGTDVPHQQDFISNPHGPGWHVDRRRFDAELRLEAERAGATVINRLRVSHIVREQGEWRLNHIRARYLVDAAGRNGLRIDAPATREIDDCLLVQILRISYQRSGPRDWRTVVAAAPSGWWYWSPLPDGDAIAMLFTCREEYAGLRRLAPAECMRTAPAICELVRSGHFATPRWIAASSSIRKAAHGTGWIAAGDSHTSFDPLSGRGIFNALRSASIAADAAHAELQHGPAAVAAFEATERQKFMDYVRQRRLYYLLEQRWSSNPFWELRQRPTSKYTS